MPRGRELRQDLAAPTRRRTRPARARSAGRRARRSRRRRTARSDCDVLRRGRGRRASTSMLGRHELAGLLEVRGRGQDLGQLAGQRLVRPQPVRGRRRASSSSALKQTLVPACTGPRRRPRSGTSSIASSSGDVVHEAVADPRGELDRLRPEAGDEDRRRLVRAGRRRGRSRPCSGGRGGCAGRPCQSVRITSTASSSISSRTSASGQRSPRMCSLSASPLPTPRVKRPSSSTALVAAAWAMIAGWMRTVGQVTAGGDRQRRSPAAIAPITDHTNGLWPCSSFHGW